jgi:hypothetical protein
MRRELSRSRCAPALLLLVCFAVEARGQGVCRPGEPCFRGPVPHGPASVVRVRNELGGSASLGSGTLVAKDVRYGWIVTCAHLFADGRGRVSAFFPAANHRYYAEIVAVERRHDLALLAIRSPPAEPSPVAASPPAPGARRVFHGFGQGTYRAAAGVALGAASLDGGQTRDALRWSGAARQGDSGGPVFNARGALVAVIAASDGRASVGGDCLQVRALLEKHLPRFQTPEGEPHREGEAPAEPRRVPGLPAGAGDDALARLRDEVAALREQLEQRPAPSEHGWASHPCHPECDKQLESLAARLTALEAAFEGQIRYRLRRVPAE